jgi:hypothetical protein
MEFILGLVVDKISKEEDAKRGKENIALAILYKTK